MSQAILVHANLPLHGVESGEIPHIPQSGHSPHQTALFPAQTSLTFVELVLMCMLSGVGVHGMEPPSKKVQSQLSH